jgi:Tol biopolymer transport system component
MVLLMIGMVFVCSCPSVESPQDAQQTTALIPTPTFQPEAPPWQKPVGDEKILPAPLYFVSTSTNEKNQTCDGPHIVRIERDGHTRTVITPCNEINGFDVSPINESVAIVARGGLWIVDTKSKEPILLFRGSPNPEYTDSPIFDIQNPVWSPDGTKIAYEDDGGIRILNVATGSILHAVDHDMCKGEAAYFSPWDPCLYRGRYRILQWSSDSKSLLVLHQEEDYRDFATLTLNSKDELVSPYVIDFHASYFHTITWGKDGNTFLLDRYERASQEQSSDGKYSLWRTSRDGSVSQLVWPYQERRNFLSLYKISENENIYNALETTDGRILCFLGGYIVKLNPVGNTFKAEVITKRPASSWGWRWYKNGNYIAVRYESGRSIDNGNGYVGKEYIGVIKVETGKIYLLAEEDMDAYPGGPSEDNYSEGNNHLIWGQP